MDTKKNKLINIYKFKFFMLLLKIFNFKKYYISLFKFLGLSDFTHRYFRSLG